MQSETIAGSTTFTKTGRVEAVGPQQQTSKSVLFTSVTFNDGEALKNVIADSVIGPYLLPDQSGTYYFAKFGKGYVFLCADVGERGLRVADPDIMKSQSMPFKIILGIVIAAICLILFVIAEAGTFGLFLWIAFLLIPLVLMSRKISAMGGFVDVIRAFEKRRSAALRTVKADAV